MVNHTPGPIEGGKKFGGKERKTTTKNKQTEVVFFRQVNTPTSTGNSIFPRLPLHITIILTTCLKMCCHHTEVNIRKRHLYRKKASGRRRSSIYAKIGTYRGNPTRVFKILLDRLRKHGRLHKMDYTHAYRQAHTHTHTHKKNPHAREYIPGL